MRISGRHREKSGKSFELKKKSSKPMGLVLEGGWHVSMQHHDPAVDENAAGTVDIVTEVRREAALLKTGALQSAIFNSAYFSSIATDEKGVIQLFNVGAERMLGYTEIGRAHV